MVVAVIADTHMPRGSRRLPDRCVELISESDAVIHAGDFTGIEAFRLVAAIGPPVHAIHGNADEPELRRRLPAELTLELNGHRIAVVHDAGSSRGRLERMQARFPDAAAVIYGHSHLPVHSTSGGFQIFNPGSPTERRRAPSRSMGLMRVSDGGIRLEHVTL